MRLTRRCLHGCAITRPKLRSDADVRGGVDGHATASRQMR